MRAVTIVAIILSLGLLAMIVVAMECDNGEDFEPTNTSGGSLIYADDLFQAIMEGKAQVGQSGAYIMLLTEQKDYLRCQIIQKWGDGVGEYLNKILEEACEVEPSYVMEVVCPREQTTEDFLDIHEAMTLGRIEVGSSGCYVLLTDEQIESLRQEVIAIWGSEEEALNAANESACERERI